LKSLPTGGKHFFIGLIIVDGEKTQMQNFNYQFAIFLLREFSLISSIDSTHQLTWKKTFFTSEKCGSYPGLPDFA
jgi:hypothetical protein